MIARTEKSERLFERAKQSFPGGVNSPVRAFRSVGGTPRFFQSGAGASITDADGNVYIDYVLSWGALALGHAHEGVVAAIKHQAERGTSYGAPTELETQLGELVSAAVPSIEKMRFVSSGTEAVMSAVRVARAATGRDLIVKFDGCYHGHADAFLVAAGSGAATLALPDSPGVTRGATADTLSIPYNSVDDVTRTFSARGDSIAAVVVEPVAGNMGMVAPSAEFIGALRDLTARHGALLIFDEVMTGFRVAFGGAQSEYDVRPDLTCLGKIIGGGLPAAAYGGREDLMQLVAPEGAVYQAGTLSGNPLAMAAGIATLRELAIPGTHQAMHKSSVRLATGLRAAASDCGITVQASALGGMWGFFFSESPVTDYAAAKLSDSGVFRDFFHGCLANGVYLPPSPFEACFVSTAHGEEILCRTIEAFGRVFNDIAERRPAVG